VNITAPDVLHREIGVAVTESGRRLWIEKPEGNAMTGSAAESRSWVAW